MSEEKQVERIGTPVMPNLVPDSYRAEKIHDTSSPACEGWHKLLTPGESALRVLYWQIVADCWKLSMWLYETAMEKLPFYNKQRIEYNNLYCTRDTKFKEDTQSAEENIPSLEEEKKVAKNKKDQAEVAYRTAEAAYQFKKAAVDRVEGVKRSLTLIKTDEPSITTTVILWVIRVVLGIALALSLGLIIGALNQYRPFSWILIAFWLIGSVILYNSGTVINWLAEQASKVSESKRFKDATCPRGNKWLWLLAIAKLFYSTSDAAVLMFGAFRLLSVDGTQIPIPILFMVCYIFVLPYLCLETRCGWIEGERKVREYVLEEMDWDEKNLKSVSFDSLATELAKVKELEVIFNQYSADVIEIDAKITEIRGKVEKPIYEPPVDYGVGIYSPNGGKPVPTQLAEFIEPPYNESLTIANRRFWKALDTATAFDEELKGKVLAREAKELEMQSRSKRPIFAPSDAKGFFGRLRFR